MISLEWELHEENNSGREGMSGLSQVHSKYGSAEVGPPVCAVSYIKGEKVAKVKGEINLGKELLKKKKKEK